MKYTPHDYQQYAADFILEHPVAAVFLEMGLGKTVVTLTAIQELCLNRFEVRKVLIVAPLRVARDTWPAEIHKWDHLRSLTYSVAVGTETERMTALMTKANLHIINRENLDWLINKSGMPFDYDMVVIDELSSFKSHQSKRFRSLLKVRPRLKRIVGLTGTPSSNGLMDLWAEFRILDMGERLGRFITGYRERFFLPDKRSAQMVYSYKPAPGAEQSIYDRISDITISMKSCDFLTMPECVINEVAVRMDAREKQTYDSLRQTMVAKLEGKEIDAVNAASLSGKLLQIANGAVYDDDRKYHHIHDRKLDALEDIIEAANGKPVLVAYWYKHDLERIRQRFSVREIKSSEEVKSRHIRRLRDGLCTVEYGFVLDDLLTAYERSADHCSNIAVEMLQVAEGKLEAHEYLNALKSGQLQESAKFSERFKTYRTRYTFPEEQSSEAGK